MAIVISAQQIRKLAPTALGPYLDAFENAAAVLGPYGINADALRVCHFMAQVLTETGDLKIQEENLDYTASRLCAVWPNHFHSIAEAAPYAGNPQKLGNYIYGQTSIAQALGNTEPGDGYNFRGRGLLQITGRHAYTRYGEQLGIDLVGHPELAFDAGHCLSIAAAEWSASGHHGKSCNQLADADDISGVTYAINGGQTGIDDRKLWLRRAKAIWLASPPIASRAVAQGNDGAQPG